MTEQSLYIKFVINCSSTKPGQDLYILGSVDELGQWKKSGNNKLKTDKKKFPKWESDFIQFSQKYSDLQYKYAIIEENSDNIQWEKDIKNRELNLSNFQNGKYLLNNANFDTDSGYEKIIINQIDDYDNDEVIKIPIANRIGLQNVGSSCYMNATLQCFCHTIKFIQFFKKRELNSFDQNTLSYSFKNLIDNLWKDDLSPNNVNNNYYAPYEFRQKIASMCNLFINNEANDAKDLVNFIIMTLHEELNRVYDMPNVNSSNPMIFEQTNKALVFQNFVNEFKNKYQSIISDLFYAMNLTVTQCKMCKRKLYNYQIYYFLVFPLEEVRKYVIQKNMNINKMNNFNKLNALNEVSIYDCFDYDKKVNLMAGLNKMYCNFCNANNDSFFYTNLITGPDTLILLLNRGKGIQFKVKINFVEYLNLEKYIEKKNTGVKYELFGVITHIGESGQGGHFIAYCRDPFSNDWSKFNDAIVTPVNNFKNEILDFANPYLLFYQKLKA